jgi:hypothetical protein
MIMRLLESRLTSLAHRLASSFSVTASPLFGDHFPFSSQCPVWTDAGVTGTLLRVATCDNGVGTRPEGGPPLSVKTI